MRIFGSEFIWELAAGDMIIAIPPKGKYVFITTTSLNSITRIICKLGGPNNVCALSNRVSKRVRTYTITVERRFIYPETKILNTRPKDKRVRSRWTDAEWIKFFQGTGRNKGSFATFVRVEYRKFKHLESAKKKYWQLIERAGLPLPPWLLASR